MEIGRHVDTNLFLPYVSVTAFASDSTSKPTAPSEQGYRRCQPPRSSLNLEILYITCIQYQSIRWCTGGTSGIPWPWQRSRRRTSIALQWCGGRTRTPSGINKKMIEKGLNRQIQLTLVLRVDRDPLGLAAPHWDRETMDGQEANMIIENVDLRRWIQSLKWNRI